MSIRMEADRDFSKPQNRRFVPPTSMTQELKKHRNAQIIPDQKVKGLKNALQDNKLKECFSLYETGKINQDQLYKKVTGELDYKSTPQFEKFIQNGSQSYSQLVRSLKPANYDIYVPKNTNSFSDRKETLVAVQQKTNNQKDQIYKTLKDFSSGSINSAQFKSNLMNQNVPIDQHLIKLIDQSQYAGVHHRELGKAVLNNIESSNVGKLSPNQQMPSQHNHLNKYNLNLPNMEQSIKNYCDTHVLIHGTTGATVGKRADVLTKLYKGTPDLLAWNKDQTAQIGEYQYRKKFRRDLQATDIFNTKKEESEQYVHKNVIKEVDCRKSSGDILAWRDQEADSGKMDFQKELNFRYTSFR